MNVIGPPPLTEPIRSEHRELLPRIKELADSAAWMADAPMPVIRERLNHVLTFLRHHLIPHAVAEDEVLYHAVEDAMSAPGASATMRRDHVEILHMTEALEKIRDELGGRPTEDQRDRLTQLLYGLHAIVSLHFAKEEEIYLAALDRWLTPEAANELFKRMEQAAEHHRAAI
jgi:iron-sulfur cluster repair protein YtfE (RIC family)